jgi:hypothetical protein
MTLTSEAEEQARIIGEAQRQKYEAIVSELSARRDLLTLDIDALERVQADYRGRLRAVLEKELEELDRRASLPTPAKTELHEIDLSAVPVPPDPEEPEVLPTTPTPSATAWGPPPESDEPDESEASTEALVVLDEELADSGPSGASTRRRA